ncbi:dicarboxylate/amino acid:cation symporter [Brevibacillus centrosporus]|uniref:dicarboxylate/amino acid:cation symporter n=1 Tax=Brevibacillus centrosporus TaxID=54910 RepID=UPI0011435E1A|nr:dicarboxylate/amino acid:cation symporter [Brevibacillus centrosporus]MEC2133346.1 dicarboxylate/amino acid:cation symporter [Brevibacillus centrosporus]GED34517.1 sodium:dicarboxylate symporter [Brevibacillus centrosporus]
MNLATKTLLGIVLGVAAGLGLSLYAPDVYNPLNNYLLDPVGSLFVKAIKMIVVPLIFTAIVTSIAGTGSLKKLGQIGSRTMSLFVITTVIACTIGILTTLVIGPGSNVTIPENVAGVGNAAPQIPSIKDMIVNIIPSNAIGAMAQGDLLQVLTFAIFFGVALTILGERAASLRNVMNELNELMMKLVDILMKAIPFAAFALVAKAMGTAGVDLIGAMFMYVIAVIIAIIIHVFVTFGTILTVLSKRNAIHFLRKMTPAIGTAFATSSSAATLPVTTKCCENELMISKNVSSFVLPLGMTVNMNGTSLHHGVAAVFVAQLSGIELGLSAYLTVIFISLLASIGAPAIPGGGFVSLSMIFLAVGLPIDGVGIAIILGLFRLVDMLLTPINVLGDAVCASVIDRRLNFGEQIKDQSAVS